MLNIDTMQADERAQLFADVFRWVRKHGGGMTLPLVAYQERVKTWHTVFVDLAVVYQSPEDNLSVLLERRPESGHLYPGMYDFSGGNFHFRETAEAAAERILLGGLGLIGARRFAGVATYVKTKAEIGVSLLFVVTVDKKDTEPGEGLNWRFFPLDELPKDVVPWQTAVYPKMIRNFISTGCPTLEEYYGQE